MPRKRTSWVTTLFNESAIGLAGTVPANLILLNDVDWGGNVASVNKNAHVKRVMFSGFIAMSHLTTTFAEEQFGCVWACHVNDEGKTIDLNTTANDSNFQGSRVIQCGTVGITLIEVPLAQAGTAFVPSLPIHFDVRTNVLVKPTQSLIMSAQTMSDITSVSGTISLTGISRVLIEEP